MECECIVSALWFSSERKNLSPFTKDFRGLDHSKVFLSFCRRSDTTYLLINRQIHNSKLYSYLCQHLTYTLFQITRPTSDIVKPNIILTVAQLSLKHTFSAFWLRSSVVSVLISLISGTGTTGPKSRLILFLIPC